MARESAVATNDVGESTFAECEVVIVNRAGLHARAAARLAQVAAEYEAAVVVDKDGRAADGRDPLELVLLDAPAGTTLHLKATGTDARELVGALAALIECGFGENCLVSEAQSVANGVFPKQERTLHL